MKNKRENKLEDISRNTLFLIRKEKVNKEIETAKKILMKGVEPLKIADEFIHSTFELFKEGIRDRNPEFTEKDVKKQVQELLSLNEQLKLSKRRKYTFG